MKDNFSTGSDKYAQFRPTYPQELFDFLLTLVPRRERAWDCGTGNGQVAAILATTFRHVSATDISAAQLQNAILHQRIEYSVQSAEKTAFPNASFDCITVAQAIHWFDFDAFYAEVNRTIRPGGILAVIGYDLVRFDAPLDSVLDAFYRDVVGPYWDRERHYIDEQYKTIPFPYTDIPTPEFDKVVEWSFDHLIGYIGTWSAVKHYQKAQGVDPVKAIQPDLKKNWGAGVVKKGRFPILLRVAKPLLLALCLLCGRLAATSQITGPKMAFIVDSFLVLRDPEPGDDLHEGDIAERKIIKNKDSLFHLGYAGYAGVVYIFTKAYRARPDSLRSIPSTRQMSVVNGVLLLHGTPYTGPVIDYYSTGRKRMITWTTKGRTDGRQTMYYPTGEVMSQSEYRQGTIDGEEKQFYPDGAILHKGRFSNGKQDGVWEFYYPNGQVKVHTAFAKGLRVDSAIRYYSNGKLRRFYPGALTLRQAKKAVQLDSRDADAWFILGKLQLNRERFDEAIDALDRAIAIEPYMEIALANRAQARIRKYNMPIPPAEKQIVCDDLQKAIFLGYRVKMNYDALRIYCQ